MSRKPGARYVSAALSRDGNVILRFHGRSKRLVATAFMTLSGAVVPCDEIMRRVELAREEVPGGDSSVSGERHHGTTTTH